MKTIILSITLSFFFFTLLIAQPDNQISFQGILADESGNALPDGTYSVTFRIYDIASGGSSIWSETQNVNVSNGEFSVYLGVNTPITFSFDDQYWIGIAIEEDTELSPRIKLSSSPYAFYALTVPENSINSYHIQSGGVAGQSINQMGAASGQALKWNGSQWAPADDYTNDLIIPYYSVFNSSDAGIALENESSGPAFAGNNYFGNIGHVSGVYPIFGQNTNTMNEGYIGGIHNAVYGVFNAQANWGSIGSVRNGVIGHKTGTNDGAGVLGIYSSGTNTFIENPQVAAAVVGYQYPTYNKGVLGHANYGAYGEYYVNGNFGYLGGSYYGVYGINGTNNNFGYFGGGSFGAYGEDATYGNYGYLGSDSYGVYGQNNNNESLGYLGGDYGAYGKDNNTGNFGFLGDSDHGIYGLNRNSGHGITGVVSDGDYVLYSTDQEVGVFGYHAPTRNTGYLASNYYGAYGFHTDGNYGYLGSTNFGVYGYESTYGNYGYIGSWNYAVYGINGSSDNWGSLGNSNYGAYGYSGVYDTEGYLGGRFGAYGIDNNTGNEGYLGFQYAGVYGINKNLGPGVMGVTRQDYYGYFWILKDIGVYGLDDESGNYGFLGSEDYGVYGEHDVSSNYGYIGSDENGVYGMAIASNDDGVKGENDYWGSEGSLGGIRAVEGYYDNGSTYGFLGGSNIAVYGIDLDGWAGYFVGDVYVSYDLGVGTSSPSYDLHVVGNAAKTSGSSWISLSDGRLKDVKSKYERGIEEISQLEPIIFSFKKDNPLEVPSDDEYVGIIAQDLQNIFPEALSEYGDGYLAYNADPIFWALINAVKQQQKQIDSYEERFEQQQKMINDLIKMYDDLKQQISKE
jgi:hypothetical protein